jgi:hypothetical protein
VAPVTIHRDIVYLNKQSKERLIDWCDKRIDNL